MAIINGDGAITKAPLGGKKYRTKSYRQQK
jgi:hypothetical protein